MSTEPAARFSLRALPIPAKVVVTCFLLAVGGGYTAAMVQLHMQDSKSGEMMPTIHDVILKYTGKKWFETDPPQPKCRLETLIMGPVEGAPWNGTGSMAPAFFHKDGGEWNKLNAVEKAKAEAERNGEREVIRQWINAPTDARKKAHEDNKFTTSKPPQAITDEFKHPDGSFKVKSILDVRCVRCHSKDSAQDKFPLEAHEQIEKYLVVPPTVS